MLFSTKCLVNKKKLFINWFFGNSTWWRPPSWKSLFWPLLINWLSDFSEILYEEAERHADKGYGTKMQMCKIHDGGRPPFWKSSNRHISVKNCPILMKFGTLHQILKTVTVSHVTKKWNFWNSRWRQPLSWISLFWS